MTAQTSPPTGTHHYVLTLQAPTSSGFLVRTFSNSFTPPPGWTRAAVFSALVDEIVQSAPRYEGAQVMFWSMERNTL
jgi:hypothetical protein